MASKRKSRRTLRNAPLSATERRSLKSILRKHRRNPSAGYYIAHRVSGERKGHTVTSAWWPTLEEAKRDLASRRSGGAFIAVESSGSRDLKPLHSNPSSYRGKLYHLSDGSVLTAAQYKRIWPGGKAPGPKARRLLGITVTSSTARSNPRRRNPTAAGRRAKARTAAGRRAVSWYATTSGRSNDRAMDHAWHLSRIAQVSGGLNKFASYRKAGASRGLVRRRTRR